jgi:hypothetical protein
MWKRHIAKIDKKELELNYGTKQKLEPYLSNISEMLIEDKIEMLTFVIDSPGIDYNLIKKYSSDPEIRNLLISIKLGTSYFDKQFALRTNKVTKKEYSQFNNISNKDQQSIIEACKAYLMFQKVGLFDLPKDVVDYFNSEEINPILNAVKEAILSTNSFNCDESTLNRIKSIERQERMDDFLRDIES